jgi:Holliday junction resolvase RusA-like endonuclease
VIILSLPLPPSSNKRVRPIIKDGKPTMVSTKKDNNYFALVRQLFVMRVGRPPVPKGAIRFHLDVWVPAYNYDSTNRLKTLEDALEALAYENDHQVISHRIERWLHGVHPAGQLGAAPAEPGVVVGIEQLEADDRTQPWLARFPSSRPAELEAPAAPARGGTVRSDVELATTAKQWSARGLLKPNVVRGSNVR